jgi:sec-independent protein translocase protein TatA
MPNVGPLEIAVVLVIVLIVFGPKRLPELGKSMGQGIRGFRGAMSGDHDDDDDSVEAKKRELEQAQANLAAAEAKADKPAEGEVVTEPKG